MNAYKILTKYNHSQTHIVVADNMADAESLYSANYGGDGCEIQSIELISNYVIVMGVSKE